MGADWYRFDVRLLEIDMFDDGVAAVEDDVELAIGIDFDAFDHLADGIVVVFTAAVSEAFYGSFQFSRLFQPLIIGFACLPYRFQPLGKLGDLVGDFLEFLLIFIDGEFSFQGHVYQCHHFLVEHIQPPHQQVRFVAVLIHADGICDRSKHDRMEVVVVITCEFSYGYRPNRSAQQAIQKVKWYAERGYTSAVLVPPALRSNTPMEA